MLTFDAESQLTKISVVTNSQLLKIKLNKIINYNIMGDY